MIYAKSLDKLDLSKSMVISGPRNLLLIDIDEKNNDEPRDDTSDDIPKEGNAQQHTNRRCQQNFAEQGLVYRKWSRDSRSGLKHHSVGDNVVAVCRVAYLLDMDAFKAASNVNRIADATKSLQNLLFGIKSDKNDKNGPFKLVSPEELLITDNVASASSRDGDGVILHNSGGLSLLSFDGKV
ncbi:MAG: hypothetical protein U0930_20755 [Pirellulales bacterium]